MGRPGVRRTAQPSGDATPSLSRAGHLDQLSVIARIEQDGFRAAESHESLETANL